MGSKVYLLVESDKSQCDPLSRMMKDLVGQLKTGAKCWKPPYLTNVEDRICVKIPEPRVMCAQPREVCRPKSCCEPPTQVFYLKCEPPCPPPPCCPPPCPPPPCCPPPCPPPPCCSPPRCPSPCPPPKCCPPPPCCPRPASIAAEACIDAEGRANAKIFVNGCKVIDEKRITYECPPPPPQPTFCLTECPPPSFCVTECPPPCPTKKPEYPWCKKRNGLDPTHAELRGMPKFEYLPHSCKIPEYKCCRVVERMSIGSASSINPRSRKYQENLAAMKDCAKNLTEARLVKYNACTRMRNGLQDKCDPLVKRTLRSCCKPKKC